MNDLRPTIAIPAQLTNDALAALMKAEILVDIANGVVPDDVSSFSELHDYVDANEYAADLVERREELEPLLEFVNDVTDIVDEWLRAGRP